jgi:hypothetical protein
MQIAIDVYTDSTQGPVDRTIFRQNSDGEAIALMADGSDMAFAYSFQPIIDLVKTQFLAAFDQNSGSIQDRMLRAATVVHESMFERFPSSQTFGENQYSATFIAAAIVGGFVSTVCIGSQQAKLFRGRACINATIPHVTMLPAQKENNVLTITSKFFSSVPGESNHDVEFCGPWKILNGDVLIIADHRLFTLASDDELASLIYDGRPSPATALVEWAQALHPMYGQSAIVGRIKF